MSFSFRLWYIPLRLLWKKGLILQILLDLLVYEPWGPQKQESEMYAILCREKRIISRKRIKLDFTFAFFHGIFE